MEGDNDSVILIEQQWKRWADLTTYFNSANFRALLGAMKMLGENYKIQVNGCTQEVSGSVSGVNDHESQVKSVS